MTTATLAALQSAIESGAAGSSSGTTPRPHCSAASRRIARQRAWRRASGASRTSDRAVTTGVIARGADFGELLQHHLELVALQQRRIDAQPRARLGRLRHFADHSARGSVRQLHHTIASLHPVEDAHRARRRAGATRCASGAPAPGRSRTRSPESCSPATQKRCVIDAECRWRPSPAPARCARAPSPRSRSASSSSSARSASTPESTAGRPAAGKRCQQRVQLQQRGDGDVGQDQVDALVGRWLFFERARAHVHDVGHVVAIDVLLAHACGHRLELDRRNIEAPSRAAAIDRMPEPAPTSSTRMPGLDQLLDGDQAQAGGRVQAGAERHARIEQQHARRPAAARTRPRASLARSPSARRRDARRSAPSRRWPSRLRAACAPAADSPAAAFRGPRRLFRSVLAPVVKTGSADGKYVSHESPARRPAG